MGGVSFFMTDDAAALPARRVCRPRDGSANCWPRKLRVWLGPGPSGLGEEGGEIEMGERMSTEGLVRLARRGSLITGGASSSELMFSIPPETPLRWSLALPPLGGLGGSGGGASCSRGGRGGAILLGGRGGWGMGGG